MNFNNLAEMEKSVYGQNFEEDEDLLNELLAMEREEEDKKNRHQRSSGPSSSGASSSKAARAAHRNDFMLNDAALAAVLAETGEPEVGDVENDDELLGELEDLIGDGSSPVEPPRKTVAPPPANSTSSSGLVGRLEQLLGVYTKLYDSSKTEGNDAKARRHKRSVDKLNELLRKARTGQAVDESEIPPAPPNMSAAAPTPTATKPSVMPSDVPRSAHHATGHPLREAAASDPPKASPPPLPKRSTSSAPTQPPSAPSRQAPPVPARTAGDPPSSKKEEVLSILQRRRDAFVRNGKAAVAAQDKTAAVEYVSKAKLFDEAIGALDHVDVNELDLAEVPATPPPYRPKQVPKTFIEHLEYRMRRFQELVDKANKEGNARKARMNGRMVDQYKEALGNARRGVAVAVADLPSLPDMPPLPPQQSAGPIAAGKQINVAVAPSAGPSKAIPLPAVGPYAAGTDGQSRNQTQLDFLLQRQLQFKKAAIAARDSGNTDLAKKYLIDAKGFDKMIAASRSGLPVSIKDTPIPPQAQTSRAALQPRIVPSQTSSSGVGNRGEVLAMLEQTLIEQVQLCENNRMRFTRLGDVGKVKLFEGWAKTAKQDLMLVRAVAKQGPQLAVPKFHYENRQIPSADLFPDLAEDILELTVTKCRDVPLPSGYEESSANIFVRHDFPYPTETRQINKTKTVSGSQSPEFNEVVMLNIGTRKARGMKLARTLKRAPLKFEVFQKGGFLRSDKLLGTCEWKLEQLESTAEMEESLPLKDGRKAVGGLLTARIRVREPIGDAKLQVTQQKWLILDN